MSEEYNVIKASAAQNALIKRKWYPQFPTENGYCFTCRRNIYNRHGWKIENLRRTEIDVTEAKIFTGITVEEAGKRLIIGCPHCHRSYCD